MKHTKSQNKNNKSNKSIIILSSIFMVITYMIIMTVATYKGYKAQMNLNVPVISSVSIQATSGIETYRNKIEGIVKSFFSNKKFTNYDATASGMGHYQRAESEKEIETKLYELGILDDYSSFGIVYRNDSILGTVDERALDNLNKNETGAFATAENILNDSNHIWYAEQGISNSRIYFFRKANENAIFVASFYKSSLDNIVSSNLLDNNFNIFIVDQNENVIYSTNKTTASLDDELQQAFFNEERSIVSSFRYIASSDTCFDAWNTIAVLNLENQIYNYKSIIISFILVLITSLVIFWILAFWVYIGGNMNEPLTIPDEIDNITGLSNAETVENLIEDKIEICTTGSTLLLVLIAIDNYNIIKENYGEEGITDALTKTKKALEDFYIEDTILGKVGENAFIAFADFTQYDLFAAHSNIKTNLSELENALSDISLDNDRGRIKYSVGAAIYPDHSTDYDELYECANQALKECRSNERGHYVLFNQNLTNHTNHTEKNAGK